MNHYRIIVEYLNPNDGQLGSVDLLCHGKTDDSAMDSALAQFAGISAFPVRAVTALEIGGR